MKLTFHHLSVKGVGARLNNTDLNLIVATLMTNAVTEEASTQSSKTRSATNETTSGGRQHEGAYITWDAFRDTLIQWVSDQGSDFVQTVSDQEGFLSRQEIQCLY